MTFNTLVDLTARNQIRESAASKEERISPFIAKAPAMTLNKCNLRQSTSVLSPLRRSP
jgi:hypothetical protein